MISFTHGVASGDPAPDGAVLWTRAIGSGEAPVHLDCVVVEESTEGRPGAEVRRIPVWSRPERDHTVHVVVEGLASGCRYSYWFETASHRSRTGRFRTVAEDSTPLRMGVVSCAKYNAGHFNVYRHLAAQDDLGFVVHLGDYIYEASNTPPSTQTPGAGIGRDFEPLHECRTLEDYRRRYAQYRSDEGLQSLHAAHAVMAVLDDHELADNAWIRGAQEHRDEEHGPWSERLRAALTAWEEWVPSRVHPESDGDPIHRAVRLGNLGVLALTEARTNRTAPDTPDPDRSQLGPVQRAWLSDLARRTEGPWFVVASPSAMSPLWRNDLEPLAHDALRALKIADPHGDGPFFDGWDAYGDEREAIAEMLDRCAARCLILSGDIHIAVAADLVHDGRVAATEWTTASVTSQNLDDKRGWTRRTGSLEYEESILRSLGHLRYCNLDDHGYMIVTLAADAARCDWWFVDTVLRPDSAATLAYRERVSTASPGDEPEAAGPTSATIP